MIVFQLHLEWAAIKESDALEDRVSRCVDRTINSAELHCRCSLCWWSLPLRGRSIDSQQHLHRSADRFVSYRLTVDRCIVGVRRRFVNVLDSPLLQSYFFYYAENCLTWHKRFGIFYYHPNITWLDKSSSYSVILPCVCASGLRALLAIVARAIQIKRRSRRRKWAFAAEASCVSRIATARAALSVKARFACVPASCSW